MGVVHIRNIQWDRLVDVHFPQESEEILVNVYFAGMGA
jgi:hypothetical protein